MKQFITKTVISLRYAILGFGLGGLHHDGWLSIIFVITTVVGLVLSFRPERYEPEEKWSWG